MSCGEGFSTQYLRHFLPHARIEASDVDEHLVDIARERNAQNGVVFSVESVNSLHRENSSFDLVVALEILEHLHDFHSALNELSRVSRRFILFSVPWEPWWRMANMVRGYYLKDFGNTPGHIQHWNKKSFARMLKEKFYVKKISISMLWIVALVEKRG